MLAMLIAVTALADARPPGYPAFLPLAPGGVHDAKSSSPPKTTVLTYAKADTAVAKDFRALLQKDGWKIEDDVIPGMSGQRFVVTKGEHGAYFTIKPDLGDKKKTQVIVTDTSGAPQ